MRSEWIHDSAMKTCKIAGWIAVLAEIADSLVAEFRMNA
jgi:hypothetical protein